MSEFEQKIIFEENFVYWSSLVIPKEVLRSDILFPLSGWIVLLNESQIIMGVGQKLCDIQRYLRWTRNYIVLVKVGMGKGDMNKTCDVVVERVQSSKIFVSNFVRFDNLSNMKIHV